MSNIPSEDDVKKSGTGDWVDQAVREQAKKNREIASVFGEDKAALQNQKAQLAGLFSAPGTPEEEEGDRGPDLFAAERASGKARQASLADLFGGEKARQDQENDELLGMFGFNPPREKPKKKK